MSTLSKYATKRNVKIVKMRHISHFSIVLIAEQQQVHLGA